MVALLMMLVGAAVTVAGAWMVHPGAGVAMFGVVLVGAGADLAGDR